MTSLESLRVLPLTRGGFKILPLVWIGHFILFPLGIKYPRQGCSACMVSMGLQAEEFEY